MKRWLKRALVSVCAAVLGITAAALVGCASCNDACEHEWQEQVLVEATCTTEGSGLRGCSKCGTTEPYTIQAGHKYGEEVVVEATCYAGGKTTQECSVCGDVLTSNITAKAACSYEKKTVAATCTSDGYDEFTCKWCADTYKNITTRATGHDLDGAEWKVSEGYQEGCTYYYVEIAKCNACQETVTFETEIEKHSYAVSVTYATCDEVGEKTYTCTSCYESYTEEIAIDANAHTWNDGETVGNVTTYTCQHNSAHTKSVYSAKEAVEATVPAAVLAETGAVELKKAELKLDADALASVGGKDVTLKADTADKDSAIANMSDADKEKLGDNEIFDFTMTDADGASIAFNGKITVTVPYELPYGEDPDNIAVWYIDENGKPEAIEATYSYVNGQGYATFETSHFSYYTVVRLSLEERCAMYGHKYETTVVPATCGQQGYTVTECKRCHEYSRSNFTPALVHAYDTATVAPTCSEMGYTTYTCSLCGDKYVSDRTAKLAHSYVDSVVQPTCTADGYTLHKCSLCGESYTDTIVKATGHNYVDDNCSVCGRKNPNATANFYFNLLDSLANADTFYFEVKDFKMSAEQAYNNGDVEIYIYEMTLARAQIGFDETGIVGKGEGTLVGSFKETGSANDSETYFANAQFLFTNGYMYIYVDGTGLGEDGAGRTQMVMSAPQSMMTAEMEDEMGMSMEMLTQMAEAYGSGALDIVAGMASVNDNPLNSAIRAVVEYVYTKTETANGYSFELNENRLKDMYKILTEKTVAEIFNLVFGENEYQDTQAWLVASVEKTIPQFEAEVKAELVNWGISLDQVYDYIDSIMFPADAYPTDRPSVKDYIFADEMKDVTLLDIINMAMSDEPLTADVVKEMINTYGEQLGALTMNDIIAMAESMGGVEGGMGSDNLSEREAEEEGFDIDVEAILDEVVAFLNKIPVTFTTDKSGALIDFSIVMNNLDYAGFLGSLGVDTDGEVLPAVSGTMKFVVNGTYAAEYDHIVKEAEKLANANNITENIETSFFTIYVEEDATYVWREEYSRLRQISVVGNETHNGVACTKVTVEAYSFYILAEDSKQTITAMTDCHGWWEVSVPCYYVNTAYGYAWIDEEGKMLDVELDLEDERTYIESGYTRSFSVYYNPTTGKYAGNTQHNYKLVEKVAEKGCTQAYEIYRCTVCGMEYKVRDYSTGHDYEYRYVLAEGSTSCEDGALEQRYCTKCGRVDYEWECDWHGCNYDYKLVYTSPVCGGVYIRYGECPCGQRTELSDPYYWKTDCQIDEVDGRWVETEGTKYTYHYVRTYACAIEGCSFTYTVDNVEWYEYDANDEKGQTCKHYDVYTYDFGNGVTFTRSNFYYTHRTESTSVRNSYGGWTYTYTCTLCNKVTEIRAYDQYNRTVRVEYPIDDYGYYRVWTGCSYIEYSLDGEEQGSGEQHQWTWDHDKSNCTQYAPNSEYCSLCGVTYGGYEAPDHWWWNDHEYVWDDYYQAYVCDRCGTKNAKGADAWIVLEDMVDGGELKIGYFNKHDYWWNDFNYAFDNVEITIVANYDPNNENGDYGVELGGEELFDRTVTSPIGYREAGIITLDKVALAEAINNADVGVETISVVFWVEMISETTGEAYYIGYGLTFELYELSL